MITLAPLIQDLAVILAVAGIVTLLFQRIRQPVVLGYIVAGMIVSPRHTSLLRISDLPNIQAWAEIGVIFLMLSLGLDFSFRKLARVGISASTTAIFQVACQLALGYGVGRLLGWSVVDSIFIGAIISISSTTIIIKALDEMKLRTRRFAEMIFGVLVVEDLLAILILVALSTIAASGAVSTLTVITAAAKLALVVASWFVTGYFVVPRFVRYVGKYGGEEMLTIVSLALCFILVVIAADLGYSVALGAFIMGSILAESTESHRIEERLEPLRDLFGAIFFVSVGMLIDFSEARAHAGSIAAISAAVIGGKIFFTSLGALLTGQTLRTSVQVGFGMAQIGEFSFIIASLGQMLHLTSTALYPIAVGVSIVTTLATPYLIRVSHRFAVALEGRLPYRLKDAMTRYSAWALARRADAASRALFYRLLLRWVVNGVIVTAIFFLVADSLVPFLHERFELPITALAFTSAWVLALLLSAPFIWGMLMSSPRGGTLLIFRFLTIIWVGALSFKFLPSWIAVLATLLVLALVVVFFYRHLEATYRWFETNFLKTFEPAAKTPGTTNVLRQLAPWDAHLVRLKVHPNSELAGKTLEQEELRKKHGLNVIAIQRGLKTIVAPKPDQVIFPKDELLILATDEQIEAARIPIEKPPGLEDRFRHISGYELHRVLIAPGSPLAHRSIRESGLRERYGAMAVGLERGDRRRINPDSDLILRPGDVLYVVGEIESFKRLTADLAPKDK